MNRIDATDLLLGIVPGEPDPVPLPKRKPVPEPAPPSDGGPDGKDIEKDVSGYLDYLSQLCRDLGVPDIVEEYFAPVVGRWSAMHEEATRWRAAAKVADEVTESLNKPLGALDAAWEGRTADSFVDYMQTVGLAGNDLSDAMHAMAKVLDRTADGIREIVTELGNVLADTAAAGAQSMNDERTRQHIDAMRRPAREFFESVRQVLEAFVSLCDGIDGSKAFDQVKMAHTYPAQNWTANIDVPAPPTAEPKPAQPAAAPAGSGGSAGGAGGSAFPAGGAGGGPASGSPAAPAPQPPPGPAVYAAIGEVNPAQPAQQAAAAAAPGKAGPAGGMGMGGMMVPPMMAGGAPGGGNQDHTNKTRVAGDPGEIFGEPGDASPPVIGEEDDR
ncbi:WXG100 family type VII secretion target [Kibdelosporangium persicum]|uniref:Type VII secretion system (Wss) protein ESAT-6 n=1 Tax=Kibdelosporangium persicum TaxID=2698649 RepID=A0ABX2FE43_9PSEU|nr:WXG100 family type VII secretion target [Kibdelosporangium persicum]NRN69654.1 Type VII secretion system (Wss) protein ESAT-6 [Kibdelosporangium persicum]